MNMSFSHVPSPNGFEMEVMSVNNITGAMLSKKTDIAFGGLGTNSLSVSYFDSTNTYYIMNVR